MLRVVAEEVVELTETSSFDAELLRDIHEATIENGEKLNSVEGKLDAHSQNISENAEKIRWNRDMLKTIIGGLILASFLVTAAVSLLSFGVL